MCDYSLAGISSRLAQAGDQLTVHRFPSGSIGLASSKRRLREVLFPAFTVAVCVPPGARLRLEKIPERLRKQWGVAEAEVVTFTQRSWEAYVHRDSLLFANGKEVSLQELACGQSVKVLQVACEDEGTAPWRPFEELTASARR